MIVLKPHDIFHSLYKFLFYFLETTSALKSVLGVHLYALLPDNKNIAECKQDILELESDLIEKLYDQTDVMSSNPFRDGRYSAIEPTNTERVPDGNHSVFKKRITPIENNHLGTNLLSQLSTSSKCHPVPVPRYAPGPSSRSLSSGSISMEGYSSTSTSSSSQPYVSSHHSPSRSMYYSDESKLPVNDRSKKMAAITRPPRKIRKQCAKPPKLLEGQTYLFSNKKPYAPTNKYSLLRYQ